MAPFKMETEPINSPPLALHTIAAEFSEIQRTIFVFPQISRTHFVSVWLRTKERAPIWISGDVYGRVGSLLWILFASKKRSWIGTFIHSREAAAYGSLGCQSQVGRVSIMTNREAVADDWRHLPLLRSSFAQIPLWPGIGIPGYRMSRLRR